MNIPTLLSLILGSLLLAVVPLSISNQSVSASSEDTFVIHNGYWLADVRWDHETDLEPGVLRELVAVDARQNLEGETFVQFGKTTISTEGEQLEALAGSLIVQDDDVHRDGGNDIFTINKKLTEASVSASIDICSWEDYLSNDFVCAEDDVIDTVEVQMQWEVAKEEVQKDIVREHDRFDDGSWFRAYTVFHDVKTETSATVTGFVEGEHFDTINVEDSPNISLSRLQHREAYCASEPASICEIRLGG